MIAAGQTSTLCSAHRSRSWQYRTEPIEFLVKDADKYPSPGISDGPRDPSCGDPDKSLWVHIICYIANERKIILKLSGKDVVGTPKQLSMSCQLFMTQTLDGLSPRIRVHLAAVRRSTILGIMCRCSPASPAGHVY
jgi:hypothetical protein